MGSSGTTYHTVDRHEFTLSENAPVKADLAIFSPVLVCLLTAGVGLSYKLDFIISYVRQITHKRS